jgi:hypothetical protein
MPKYLLPLLVVSCVFHPILCDVNPFLELVADGLQQPVLVTHAADRSQRLFIVEQAGRIRVLENGFVKPAPFLDISTLVQTGGERGLLGLAFHPEYSDNGRFFINYTRLDGGQLETVVAEYGVSGTNPDMAAPQETSLLEFDQPAGNHNGGMLAFGPDGYLYIGTGDGGGGGDPNNNGQDLSNLLGKILRIDVDGGAPYTVPPDNPFVGQGAVRSEIYAYGLRNPWRFSFDRLTGDLFAADVGQGSWEEVDLIESGGNYGWRIMEGNHCFNPPNNCNTTGLILPIAEYSHSQGRSVTGGYVYRGLQPTSLQGSYIFGDYINGSIWSLTKTGDGTWSPTLLLDTDLSISSFGEDRHGEVYVVDYSGALYRLVFGWSARFAQIGDGVTGVGTFKSTVLLMNNNNQEVAGLLRLTKTTGIHHEEIEFTIPAKTSWTYTTPGDSVPVFVGWAEVSSDSQISGTILFSLLDGSGEPIAEAGVASSDLGTDLGAPAGFLEEFGIDTGFALANPSQTETATVELTIKDSSQVEKKISFQLGPREHVARFISQDFVLPDDFEGTALIESDCPIVVTLLRTKGGVQSASLPVAN